MKTTRKYFNYIEGGGIRYFPSYESAWECLTDQGYSPIEIEDWNMILEGPDHEDGPHTFWTEHISPAEYDNDGPLPYDSDTLKRRLQSKAVLSATYGEHVTAKFYTDILDYIKDLEADLETAQRIADRG